MSDQTYFAAAMMNEFITMVEDGLRDITNERLSPFWNTAPDVSGEEATARYGRSFDYREEHDLDLVSEASFAGQVSKGSSQDTFIRFLEESGIETKYVEDITSEEVERVLPDIQGIMNVVAKLEAKGIEADLETFESMFEGLETPITTETVMHLSEEDPTPWAEEDSVIAGKLIQARRYISLYFGGASG